jgi:hypothetical protein
MIATVVATAMGKEDVVRLGPRAITEAKLVMDGSDGHDNSGGLPLCVPTKQAQGS